MNIFCAVGRLTSSPEYKKTPNGTSLVRFTLAVDRQFKDKDGNKITDFIPCQAWRQTADYMQQYIHKGDMVSITGELHSEKYNDKQSGQQRTRYGIVCNTVRGLKKPRATTANLHNTNNGHNINSGGHSINKITTDSAKDTHNIKMTDLSLTVTAICRFNLCPRETGQKQIANSF